MLLLLGMESLAVGGISMTLARSRMFREVRWWLARERKHWPHEWVWDFVKCPWCVSHWVSGMVVAAAGKPVAVTSHVWLDFVLNWMTVVVLAPVSAAIIYQCYNPLPPVPTEQEWNYLIADLGPEEEQHGHTEVRT